MFNLVDDPVVSRALRVSIFRGWLARATIGLLTLAAVVSGRAQANLSVYTDQPNNSWQDWSWGNYSLTNTAPVYSGTYSISATENAWEAISFYHTDFNSAPYASLSFWVNGGPTGGQVLQVQGQLSQVTQSATSTLSPLLPGVWQQITIPLSAFGVANAPNFDRFWIQMTASGTTNTYYLDNIQLNSTSPPTTTHISITTTQTVRSVDARWFGINTAVWDGDFDTPGTVSLLSQIGIQALRFPGGSLSDDYHWATDTSDSNTWTWTTGFPNFVHVATNLGVQACITVNYGTGTPAEAAGWVLNANVTNHCAFKYWEIGNEEYGSWETDSNTYPHDPYTYAVRAQSYIQQMKAADPTIKIGVMVVPGEDNYANYATHGAYNSRTGSTHYGWTAVLLTTLKSLGVTPDFLIHHRYPENQGGENDAALLQSSVGWASDAADLRQQITDYFGPTGTNIELLCTENNSISSGPGKQTTSLVNGLFLADSMGQLMQTEFNSLFWWDLRNGQDTEYNLSSSLYGWRLYGDYGIVDGQTDLYPTFYASKLMQYFARGGDSVLSASSDYAFLSAYAARHVDGAVTVLVINKDPVNTLAGQLALTGFVPGANATVRSYGIPQDNAAQSGVGSTDLAQTNFPAAAATFNYTFAPYSLTLFTLVPAAPSLSTLPPQQQPPGQVVIQLRGQTAVRYVVQTSTDLSSGNWTSISTNTLSSGTLNLTNAISSGQHFYRAVWQP